MWPGHVAKAPCPHCKGTNTKCQTWRSRNVHGVARGLYYIIYRVYYCNDCSKEIDSKAPTFIDLLPDFIRRQFPCVCFSKRIVDVDVFDDIRGKVTRGEFDVSELTVRPCLASPRALSPLCSRLCSRRLWLTPLCSAPLVLQMTTGTNEDARQERCSAACFLWGKPECPRSRVLCWIRSSADIDARVARCFAAAADGASG